MAQIIRDSSKISSIPIAFVAQKVLLGIRDSLHKNKSKRVKRAKPFQISCNFRSSTKFKDLSAVGVAITTKLRDRRYSKFIRLQIPHYMDIGAEVMDENTGLAVRIIAEYHPRGYLIYRADVLVQ